MENETKKTKYSDAQRRATQKWRKENTVSLRVQLSKNNPEDAEVIAWLSTLSNKAGSVRAALLKAARGE
ncbi:MAG: hypothetical protein IJS52_07990 [Bacilli bacterium]|nr:hypothetical protein [Bacilli bacterium]